MAQKQKCHVQGQAEGGEMSHHKGEGRGLERHEGHHGNSQNHHKPLSMCKRRGEAGSRHRSSVMNNQNKKAWYCRRQMSQRGRHGENTLNNNIQNRVCRTENAAGTTCVCGRVCVYVSGETCVGIGTSVEQARGGSARALKRVHGSAGVRHARGSAYNNPTKYMVKVWCGNIEL